MKPIPHARPLVRLASVVAVGFALWLLLVPRIALYYLDDNEQPYDVDVKYAWGRGTSDQTLIMPEDLFSEEEPAAGGGGLVTSVRLNCGLVFTSGENEAATPGGPAACSEVETPRLLGGAGLALLGIAGLALAGRIPARRDEIPSGTDDSSAPTT